jgi:hypothetical protein
MNDEQRPVNDEQQIRELLMTAAELPYDLQPPVARLLRQGQRRRTRRTTLMATTAAVAVLAASGIPAVVHALRAAKGQPGGTGLFGPRPAASTGPAAAQLARFRWSKLPPSPLGERLAPAVAWTGRELIELGGLGRQGGTLRPAHDGAAFNPATGRWHRIAGIGSRNIGFGSAVTVWTGRQLFVANGLTEKCPAKTASAGCQVQAGLYNPVTNRWAETRLPAALDGLSFTGGVWTGRDVIVAGVNFRGLLAVGAYNPATGRWRMVTPTLPAGHPIQFAYMTVTSSRLILWSLWHRGREHGPGVIRRSGVDVLALSASGTWRDVTGNWPQHQTVNSQEFTGTQILVSPGQLWCGSGCDRPSSVTDGYFADPSTLARTTIPAGPIGHLGPEYVWTGRAILAVNDTTMGIGGTGGNNHITVGPGLSALFDPGTGHWQGLPHPPGYPHVGNIVPVWGGHELFLLSTGGEMLALHG